MLQRTVQVTAISAGYHFYCSRSDKSITLDNDSLQTLLCPLFPNGLQVTTNCDWLSHGVKILALLRLECYR
jgi:hypothetical protein